MFDNRRRQKAPRDVRHLRGVAKPVTGNRQALTCSRQTSYCRWRVIPHERPYAPAGCNQTKTQLWPSRIETIVQGSCRTGGTPDGRKWGMSKKQQTETLTEHCRDFRCRRPGGMGSEMMDRPSTDFGRVTHCPGILYLEPRCGVQHPISQRHVPSGPDAAAALCSRRQTC